MKAKLINVLNIIIDNPSLLKRSNIGLIYLIMSHIDKDFTKGLRKAIALPEEERMDALIKFRNKMQGSNKPKQSFKQASEEDAMNSVLEEIDGIVETLPDETVQKIGKAIDGYFINRVNNELIAEFDG